MSTDFLALLDYTLRNIHGYMNSGPKPLITRREDSLFLRLLFAHDSLGYDVGFRYIVKSALAAILWLESRGVLSLVYYTLLMK